MISGSRDDNAGSVVMVFGSFGPFTGHNIRGWRALNHLSVDQPRPHQPCSKRTVAAAAGRPDAGASKSMNKREKRFTKTITALGVSNHESRDEQSQGFG